jgi:hypothetical protein
VPEELSRFFEHGRGHFGVVFAKATAVARGRKHAIEPEPLGEELIESRLRSRIVEHPSCGRFDLLSGLQLPAGGCGQ